MELKTRYKTNQSVIRTTVKEGITIVSAHNDENKYDIGMIKVLLEIVKNEQPVYCMVHSEYLYFQDFLKERFDLIEIEKDIFHIKGRKK